MVPLALWITQTFSSTYGDLFSSEARTQFYHKIRSSIPEAPSDVVLALQLADLAAVRNSLAKCYNHTNELGCWLSGHHSEARMAESSSAEIFAGLDLEFDANKDYSQTAFGYRKLNLRKTNGANVQAYRHQFAALLSNPKDLLLYSSSHVLECSHLCGNSFCFNPAHVVIESKRENQNRQACSAATEVWIYRDDILQVVINPCPHSCSSRVNSINVPCVLPRVRVDLRAGVTLTSDKIFTSKAAWHHELYPSWPRNDKHKVVTKQWEQAGMRVLSLRIAV